MSIIFFIFSLAASKASENYPIPAYYGSRALDFLIKGSILQGDLSSMYWYPRVCQHLTENETIYYVADSFAIFEVKPSIT